MSRFWGILPHLFEKWCYKNMYMGTPPLRALQQDTPHTHIPTIANACSSAHFISITTTSCHCNHPFCTLPTRGVQRGISPFAANKTSRDQLAVRDMSTTTLNGVPTTMNTSHTRGLRHDKHFVSTREHHSVWRLANLAWATLTTET